MRRCEFITLLGALMTQSGHSAEVSTELRRHVTSEIRTDIAPLKEA
jgi:hypothetical protein